jgi:hypothetical protein
VCPCAQELLRDLSQRELAKELGVQEGLVKRLLRKTPIASHMQRSFGSIMLDVPDGFSIDAVHLIRIIESSMSSSSFELLKRADEAEVVRTAIRKPRFVEDCIKVHDQGLPQGLSHAPRPCPCDFLREERGERPQARLHCKTDCNPRPAAEGSPRQEVCPLDHGLRPAFRRWATASWKKSQEVVG